MGKFIVNQGTKEEFKYLKNICALLSVHKRSSFDMPASVEKIEQWENENHVRLPHQYKSWLALTSGADIADGHAVFTWPETGSYKKDSDVVIIGSIMGDGETVYISRGNRNIFSVYKGKVKQYEDFDELLLFISIFIDGYAEEFLGESWEDIYDECYVTE